MGRTQRFFRFRTLENLHKSRLFRVERSTKRFRFRVLHLRPLGQLSVYVIPHFFQKLLERTDGKNNKIFNFRTEEKPEFIGFLSGANSQLYKKFRVSPVMTTSISLRVYFRPPFSSFQKHSKILWREKQERKLKNIRFEILKTRN